MITKLVYSMFVVFIASLSSCCRYEWTEMSCRHVVITANEATVWKDGNIISLMEFESADDKSPYVRGPLTYGIHYRNRKWELFEQSVDITQGIHCVKVYANPSHQDISYLLSSLIPFNGKSPTYHNRLHPPGGFADAGAYVLSIETDEELGEYLEQDATAPQLRNLFYTFRNLTKKYNEVLPIANSEFLPELETTQTFSKKSSL